MQRDLNALAAEEHDLLVVGGGIHGAACAWEAARRGLRVALVEARDFGSGTSWNSLKTIHGGLRYLQHLDLRRMRDSIRERRRWLALAPELVRPLGFAVPTGGWGRDSRAALAAALHLADLVGYDRNRGLPEAQHLPAGRLLDAAEWRREFPGVAPGDAGGALWYDAQVASSERLLLGLLHAAAQHGARLANYCEARELLRGPGGQIEGARLADRAHDEVPPEALPAPHLTAPGSPQTVWDVRAKVVLDCTGPWLDRWHGEPGRRSRSGLLRAYNLVLQRPLGARWALGLRAAGRYLFAVPWQECALLGTAYEAADGPPGVGARAFFEECRRVFAGFELRAEEVSLVHTGWVPAARGAGALATRAWLADRAADGLPGLVSLQGVKLTTAAARAREALDLVCRRLGRAGAAPAAETCAYARPLAALARDPGWRAAWGLAGPPPSDVFDDTVRLAVRAEQARHLSDLVLRRCDWGATGRPPASLVARAVRVMAAELGRDAAWEARQQAALDARLQAARLPPDPAPGPAAGRS